MAKGDLLHSLFGGNAGQAMTGGGSNPMAPRGPMMGGMMGQMMGSGRLNKPQIPIGPKGTFGNFKPGMQPNIADGINPDGSGGIAGFPAGGAGKIGRMNPTAPPNSNPVTGRKIAQPGNQIGVAPRNWGDKFLG